MARDEQHKAEEPGIRSWGEGGRPGVGVPLPALPVSWRYAKTPYYTMAHFEAHWAVLWLILLVIHSAPWPSPVPWGLSQWTARLLHSSRVWPFGKHWQETGVPEGTGVGVNFPPKFKYLIYIIVLVSDVQQSDSETCSFLDFWGLLYLHP